MNPREYHFKNSTLKLIFGDITQTKAQVIVSSDDTRITMGGGVSAAILNAGGEEIRQDAQKKLPVKVGDVVVSTAGELKYQKYVFHCMSMQFEHALKSILFGNSKDLNKYIIQHSVDKCFRLLHALDLSSIALPVIGTGVANIPIAEVAETMADTIAENLNRTNKEITVELYLYDRFKKKSEIDYIDMFERFAVKSALSNLSVTNIVQNTLEEEDTLPTYESLDKKSTSSMNHDVFISYSRKDKEKMKPIIDTLADMKISHWIDETGIYSGANYKDLLVKAIDQSKAVVFVSSANSNNSQYVIKEVGYAVRKNKPILPVRIDDSPFAPSIEYDLINVDHVSLFKSRGQEKFVNSLAFILEQK